jgi:hypothetical protein
MRRLHGHIVTAAGDMGWDELSNGRLLRAAEDAGFDLLLTTDRRIRYQQNLASKKIAIVVLSGSTKWSRVRRHFERIADVVDKALPGSYVEVFIPFD